MPDSSTSLAISPHGRPFVDSQPDESPGAELFHDPAASKRVVSAFAQGPWHGLLHLATSELQTPLTPSFAFAREFAGEYLTRLCRVPPVDDAPTPDPISSPPADELAARAQSAPPLRGLEYLTADALANWWTELDTLVRSEIAKRPGGAAAYLRDKSPLWRFVGRVTFHLAENKRDPENPFAFLATYASKLSAQGRVQHLPLSRALQEYSGAKNKSSLLSLLMPIQKAAEASVLAKELIDSGEIYHPLVWTPKEAYRFLQDLPIFEQNGVIVRVPDWWKPTRPPRPVVSVKIGDKGKSKLGIDALLEFTVGVTLDGERLTEAELRSALESAGGLVQLRGKWVEVDREKLSEALSHWKQVERVARGGEFTFFEGMRLLAGAPLESDTAAAVPQATREWSGISAGEGLERMLAELRDPQITGEAQPKTLHAELRPYQQKGVHWLRFMMRLGLGACLADDMGLGKTIQVIALLLHQQQTLAKSSTPSLLVAPASLIGNWKAEVARFAPSLSICVAHPSELKLTDAAPADLAEYDLVITTYSMLGRLKWLGDRKWNLLILDEAQAIKNSGTRQTRQVKELTAGGRIALTGTPVENRLSDLWSLFDFLNPGLLGGAKAFSNFVKKLTTEKKTDYAPLRTLIRPYILRRLKTDKQIITDLPDKMEVTAFCGLSKQQMALYEQAVRELAQTIEQVESIQRRGVVLASLMRLKQICNHPSQFTGDGAYAPNHSGKFHRLRELFQELAQRQEKVLIFTQFREMTGPLADFAAENFGRPGLVLHGQTAVGKRRELVEQFQRDEGPPFFILSLKAGGTGLNLTAASQVIHFDRWWNPAVENQATDRAFRIGQKKNVLVHKFVCRGTVEEKIDKLIMEKMGLANELLEGGGETLLTEMSNSDLLRFVALDINTAAGANE